MGRTRDRRYLKFHQDLPQRARVALEQIADQDRAEFDAPPNTIEAYLEVIRTHTIVPLTSWFGPAYCFSAASSDQSEITLVTPNNRQVLKEMPEWVDDINHEQPMVAWIENEVALGVCASVRKCDPAEAAGLDVLERARMRGIGQKLATAWASLVQAKGKIAMYSTSSDNVASQAVARRLGLELLGSSIG